MFFLEKNFLIIHALTTSIEFVAIQVVKKSKLLYPLHMMTGDILPPSVGFVVFLVFFGSYGNKM